ncbi:MAG: (Fe-S)-binding protein [Candidatus Freyarchaeota archaeon]
MTLKLLLETDKCIHCGSCTSVCPLLNAGLKGDPQKNGPDALKDTERVKYLTNLPFNCTLCLACQEVCPVNVPIPRVVEHLRSKVKAPESVEQMIENIKRSENIFGLKSEERWMWTFELDVTLEERIDVKADIGYFTGCNSAFSPLLSKILTSHISLLERANVNYTLLSEEACCGFPLVIAGRRELVAPLAEKNIENFKKKGVKKVITSCPACLRSWREIYPKIKEVPFEVQHTTQFLWQLVKEGKLKVAKTKEAFVYQDPCELARGCHIVEEPRKLIKETGAKLLEFQDKKLEATCCGGGGLLRATNVQAASRIALLKLQEAKRLGAKAIITACPACMQNFVKAGGRVQVLDVSEIL